MSLYVYVCVSVCESVFGLSRRVCCIDSCMLQSKDITYDCSRAYVRLCFNVCVLILVCVCVFVCVCPRKCVCLYESVCVLSGCIRCVDSWMFGFFEDELCDWHDSGLPREIILLWGM